MALGQGTNYGQKKKEAVIVSFRPRDLLVLPPTVPSGVISLIELWNSLLKKQLRCLLEVETMVRTKYGS